jgi:hypothetical protein
MTNASSHPYGLPALPEDSIDEAAAEAANLQALSQAMFALLQTAPFYEAVGLSAPPSAYTPPTEEEYCGGLRLVGGPSTLPPACSGRAV